MNVVTLKNGAEEAEAVVTVTMMSLRALIKEQPIAFYELVMKCRDHHHQIFGNLGGVLRQRMLLGADDQPHDSVRNVVLSASSGEGLSMTLGSPLPEQLPAE